jgi:hypothetical protein
MIYAYRCSPCDREKLEQRAVKHMLTKLPKCDQCGRRMKFFISSPPLAIVKNPAAGYRS